jgi:hypothetical protein
MNALGVGLPPSARRGSPDPAEAGLSARRAVVHNCSGGEVGFAITRKRLETIVLRSRHQPSFSGEREIVNAL